MIVAPDLAAPVAGWRIWNVLDGEDGPELVSPVRPQLWAHRAATSATCRAGCPRCPALQCGCGLYAAAGVGRLPLAREGGALVLGCVGLWGRVVEHTAGWRGELGYPLVLLVLSPRPVDVMRRMPWPPRSWTPAVEAHHDGAVRALSDELARLYAVPVHPARPLFHADLAGQVRPDEAAADATRVEAVTGLAGRREGDPEALARLDGRVQDLIGSVGA